MKKVFLHGVLVVLLAAALCGLRAPAPVWAGSGGHWTDIPPRLDGMAPADEWGNAGQLAYTHFQVRYENDDQFLYLLIDVTGETPAAPPAIAKPGDDFAIYIDANQDGTMELLYYLSYTSPNPLLLSTYLGNNTWTAGQTCLSYGVAGFGPSLSSATPHRIYETAIRLSETYAVVGHPVNANFYAISQASSIFESSGTVTLGMRSPAVGFIYNTEGGLADAKAFQTMLYATDGLWADLISLDQVAVIDFRPYRTILVGDDTGSTSGYTWLGSAAAMQKILQSGKPVLGIGVGGLDLFNALGLYLTHPHSWEGPATSVHPSSIGHPAWITPSAVTLGDTVSLYSSPVYHYAIYIGNADFPRQSITLLGADDAGHYHFSILGQRTNGTCYTLWGFRSQPGSLTADGQKLLANLAWQPMCMPAVLYLGGSNTTLQNGLDGLLVSGGFPYKNAFASDAASLDYSPYQTILVGWDTSTEWLVPANVEAVGNSRLPVVAMGTSGALFMQKLGVPMLELYLYIYHNETEADLVNPLQPALRRPNPVAVLSPLRTTFDLTGAGVDLSTAYHANPAISETVIGYLTTDHGNQALATQSYQGVCYQLYGFESYPENMTTPAKNLLSNMLADPICNYPVFLPLIRH